jgi:hypothetical protein
MPAGQGCNGGGGVNTYTVEFCRRRRFWWKHRYDLEGNQEANHMVAFYESILVGHYGVTVEV